jgi:hypothetical protein
LDKGELRGVGITKLDERRRLERHAEAAQQGMREFPVLLQTGHKIGNLLFTHFMKGPWQAEGLWCGKFD